MSAVSPILSGRQTTPSGAQIDLTYGNDGRPVVIQVNGAVLISDIVYQPFGAPKAWTWGNGTPYARQFDADGRLDQYPVGHETRSLGFDAAGRIVNFSHANAVLNRYFEYDAADRLTRELDNIGVSLWAYDLNSNRLSSQPGSATYAYSYPAGSNRLASVAGPVPKTYTYDAAGNIVNDGPTIFLYDEAGRLVGEYDKNNVTRQETVWLDNTPIAVLKKDPATGETRVFYVHADHLGTPRAILDSQNRVVWRWLSSAFGQGLPEEDPDRDGTLFEYNLRFPGQYWDRETGLHYNYFRDYDPSTGRYPQADPIGLAGGLNVYAYGLNNPLTYTDPLGLKPIPCPDGLPAGATCDDGLDNQNVPPKCATAECAGGVPTSWNPSSPEECSVKCSIEAYLAGAPTEKGTEAAVKAGTSSASTLGLAVRYGVKKIFAVSSIFDTAACIKACKEKFSCQK